MNEGVHLSKDEPLLLSPWLRHFMIPSFEWSSNMMLSLVMGLLNRFSALSFILSVSPVSVLQTLMSVRGSLASMLTLAKTWLVDITVPAFVDGWARTVTSVSINPENHWSSAFFHLLVDLLQHRPSLLCCLAPVPPAFESTPCWWLSAVGMLLLAK